MSCTGGIDLNYIRDHLLHRLHHGSTPVCLYYYILRLLGPAGSLARLQKPLFYSLFCLCFIHSFVLWRPLNPFGFKMLHLQALLCARVFPSPLKLAVQQHPANSYYDAICMPSSVVFRSFTCVIMQVPATKTNEWPKTNAYAKVRSSHRC